MLKRRERANLIASDWSKLRRASDTISDVRSRWTAHLPVFQSSITLKTNLLHHLMDERSEGPFEDMSLPHP
jgi:hypothetical protein